MGIGYKAFQSLSYFGLEWGRDIGKEVVKEQERERLNTQYREDRAMMDNNAIDRHWDNLLQECWDWNESSVKKGSKAH